MPRGQGRRFAPGVGELDPYFLSLGVDEICHALDGGNLGVLPEARVFRGDAAVGGHGGGFDDGEGGAVEGVLPQVDKVEVGQVAVGGRVHAHGGDGEAVLEGEAADGEGGEDGWDGGGIIHEGGAGWGVLGGCVEGDAGGRGAGGREF